MGCSEEITSTIALLQVQNVFTKPAGGKAAIKARVARRKFEVEEGDLLTYLNAIQAFENSGKSRDWCFKNFVNYKGMKRAIEIRNQMRKLLNQFDVPMVSAEGIFCL